MRFSIPLFVLLIAAGCGESDPVDGAPKSRTNEGGEIERHLRHIANNDPAARPFPSAERPTTVVLPDVETAPGAQPPSEAARARAISETHVHEHEHVDEPEVAAAQAPAAQAPAARAPAHQHAVVVPEPANAAPEVGDEETAVPVVAVAEVTTPAPATGSHAPEDASAAEATSVELVRIVTASSVANREPTGSAPFANDVGEVYLFVEARNDGTPTTLAVRWIAPDGSPGRSVDLQIPTSPRWRTWATTRRVRDRPGQWTAVVTDAAGRELGRSTFVVGAAPSA